MVCRIVFQNTFRIMLKLLFTIVTSCYTCPGVRRLNSSASIKIPQWHIFFFLLGIILFFVRPSLKSLDGEIILVTGAANGIGKAICMEILKVTKGKVNFVVWDINKQQLDDLVMELKGKGAAVFAYIVDVSDRKQVSAAADSVKREVGSITMIINNAGVMPCVKLLDQSEENVEKSFGINVLSHFWIIKEFLPEMIERNSGHIVAIASIGSLIASRNLIVYHGTKYAVNGYMEGLEDELDGYLENRNVKLTTVYPMWCNTSFAENTVKSRFKTFTKFLEPQEVAQKVVDGVRRNYSQIYIPNYLSAISLYRIQPYKIQVALRKLVNSYSAPPTPTLSEVVT